jgi:hypothetical protein
MKDKRETLQNQRVILDEKEYKDKHVEECELVITGRGPIRLVNCNSDRIISASMDRQRARSTP